MVEQLSRNPKINGSNPAATGNEKMAKIADLCHRYLCMNMNLVVVL